MALSGIAGNEQIDRREPRHGNVENVKRANANSACALSGDSAGVIKHSMPIGHQARKRPIDLIAFEMDFPLARDFDEISPRNCF